MIDRRSFLLAPTAALGACRRRKSAGFDGYAFVANEAGHAVAAVDLNTFTVARHIRVAGRPTAVTAHGSGICALTPDTGAVHEIGLADLALHRSAQVARSAVSMRKSGERLWVLCREPRQLVRVSPKEMRVDLKLSLPHEPFDFDVSRDGNWAVVSFGGNGAFAFADLEARRVLAPAHSGKPLGLVRFRPDGRQALVAGTAERMLSVVDAPSGKTVVRLPLAVRPDHLCYNRDGGQLFVTGDGMDAVVVVYPYSTEIAETVLAGRAPGAMAASGVYLFVANPRSGDVTILDIETRRAIAAVSVGEGPGFIAITPDDRYALVLNERSGDMAVIRIGAITARRARSAPLFTLVPVGSRPVSAVVEAI